MIEVNLESTGNSIPLGGVVMRISNSNDIVEEGQRFLRCGFVETDVADLDPSVITLGSYYEPQGSAIVPFDRLEKYTVSDNGTIMASHLDGGNVAARTEDNGDSWSLISVLSAGFDIEMLDTDGNGKWVAVGYDSGVSHQAKYSLDDGLTWTMINLPTPPSTGRGTAIAYSFETDSWVMYVSGSSASHTDGAVYYSSDAINWSKGTGVNGSSLHGHLIRPSGGNGTWVLYFKSGASNYFVKRSSDNGATWQTIGKGGTNWPEQTPINGLFSINGKIFAIADGDGAGSTADVLIMEFDISASTEDFGVKDKRYYPVEDYKWLFTGITKGAKHEFNGAVYFNHGWITTDGLSFRQIYTSTDDHTSMSMNINSNKTQLWMRLEEAGNGANAPFQKSIPVAGVTVGYNQGAAAQFMRIE